MDADSMKHFACQAIHQIINEKRMDVIPQVVAEDFAFRTIPGLPTGPIAFQMSISMYQTAFPDIQVHFDDVIVEHDKVVIRQTFRGTHEGPMAGVAPTGKAVTFSGIFVYRIVDEKFVEQWAVLDGLGLQNQLGQPLYFQTS